MHKCMLERGVPELKSYQESKSAICFGIGVDLQKILAKNHLKTVFFSNFTNISYISGFENIVNRFFEH